MDKNWEKKVQIWMKEHQIENVDLNLIKDALTHSSYKGMGYNVKDNERLEFLGDAVADLIIAHQLFLDSQLSEGEMTERRKDFVSNDKLANIFDNLGLNELIRTANDFLLSVKNKADFIEALLGAVFLDKKYEQCCEFWDIIQQKNSDKSQKNANNNTIPDFLNIDGLKKLEPLSKDRKLRNFNIKPSQIKNAKNTIQEYCQQRGLPIPEYELIKREGFDHRPQFTVEGTVQAVIDSDIKTITAIGEGLSIRTAEFRAAESICNKLELTYRSSDS